MGHYYRRVQARTQKKIGGGGVNFFTSMNIIDE